MAEIVVGQKPKDLVSPTMKSNVAVPDTTGVYNTQPVWFIDSTTNLLVGTAQNVTFGSLGNFV
jgi:hypothetical protein